MEIDMAGYRPYRDMAKTCKTRPIRERRIAWTKIESTPFRDGLYQVKPLRKSLIESAAELWRSAYPELYGSPHEFLLDPDQYEKLLAIEVTRPGALEPKKRFHDPYLTKMQTI